MAYQFHNIDRALEVVRHLMNILSDGEGLNLNPRISALVAAMQRYLDDVDEAMLAAWPLLGLDRPLERDAMAD